MKKVIGNTSVTFGDRHIENVYRGQHINYQENCYWCMDKTVEKVWELEPDLYNEAGDFIGVRTGVSWLSGDRIMLSRTMKFLDSIKAHKVINRGNHDLHGSEERNDYIFLSSLGYFDSPTQLAEDGKYVGRVMLESPDLIDPDTNEPLRVVFHYVPYGKEFEKLDIVEGATNVAVTHNDFRVGLDNFTNNPDAIDLKTHQAFFGVDLILNGHIHEPSRLVSFKTDGGTQSAFMNLGCMARPKRSEDYSFVWCAVLQMRKNPQTGLPEVNFEPQEFKLRPASEIFVEETEGSVVAQVKAEGKQEQLSEALEGLRNFNWAGVSMSDRLDLIVLEPEIKDMIRHYLALDS